MRYTIIAAWDGGGFGDSGSITLQTDKQFATVGDLRRHVASVVGDEIDADCVTLAAIFETPPLFVADEQIEDIHGINYHTIRR